MNVSKVFKRQLDLVKPTELDFPIIVIGAGGIGSWLVLALAKMGCQDITVYDFDCVEEKNTPSQLYVLSQVGAPKAEALAAIVLTLTNIEIHPVVEKFQEVRKRQPLPARVIICAVDSFEERKDIWSLLYQQWTQYQDFHCYIDARMGGELLRVFTVNPFDQHSVEYYNKKLFNNKKAHEEPCTAKAIVYNTQFASAAICATVKKFAKKEEAKLDFIFDIAQMTTY